jgi:thermitase
MKKYYLILSALIMFSLAAFGADDYAPGEVIVVFKPNAVSVAQTTGTVSASQVQVNMDSIKALNTKHSLHSVRSLGFKSPGARVTSTGRVVTVPDTSNFYLLKFDNKDTEAILNDYLNDPNVESASYNYKRKAFDVPNDTYYAVNQWSLPKIHLSPIGSGNSGWDITTGESSVKVAVIDTGVNYTHEDLVGRVASFEGYNYVSMDADPMDDEGHGTHCAGIIGAAANNGKGIAGVDWHCTIVPIKVLDSSGSGYDSDIISGINLAIQDAVKVISMSLGGTGGNNHDPFAIAVSNAVAANIVVVCAAGNDGTQTKEYPAAYPGAFSVAATGINDEIASYSNYGTWVDISAPGGDGADYHDWIFSTYPFDNATPPNFTNYGYAWAAGTSMATPHVAGLAALLRAKYPALTAEAVVSLIERTADKIDPENPGYSGLLGAGRINAFNALNNMYALIRSPAKNSTVEGVITIIGDVTAENFAYYNVDYGLGLSPSAWTTIASSDVGVINSKLATLDTTAINSWISLRVIVYDVATAEYDTSVYAFNHLNALIRSPAKNSTVQGIINIIGDATGEGFAYYNVNYGVGSLPLTWETLVSSDVHVVNSKLATMDTTGINDLVTLKLIVYGATTAESDTVIHAVDPVGPTGQISYGPNPFDPNKATIMIKYTLNENSDTYIYFYDIAGNLICRKFYYSGTTGGTRGDNRVYWDGKNDFSGTVANGVYLFRVVCGNKIIGKGKIVVVKK